MLTCPSVHWAWPHSTPASSWCEQVLPLPGLVYGQSTILLSFPVQLTAVIWIGPVPNPNWAPPKGSAPEKEIYVFSKPLWRVLQRNMVEISQVNLTSVWMAQLVASHTCICSIPQLITHSTPNTVLAEFHSPFQQMATSIQSYCSIYTTCTSNKLSLSDHRFEFHLFTINCRA